MRTCERCGAEHPFVAAYCGSCGAAMDAGHDTVVAARPPALNPDPTIAGSRYAPPSPSYPEPATPGSAPTQRRGGGIPPVLVGVASAVAVCLVAGGLYLGLRERDEADVAENATEATTSAPAPAESAPVPATSMPAPTSGFVARAPALSASPQPAPPAAPQPAPPGPDAAQRRAYAESTLSTYLEQVQSNTLTREQMAVYFADTVNWYGASWSRDRVYDEFGIVPGKDRTEFLTNDTRSFVPGQRYGGIEADVLEVDRQFREPGKAEIKRTGVVYTFVYDGAAAGPRIAEVRTG